MAGYARGYDALKVGSLTTVAAIGFSALFLQMTNRGLDLAQWDVHIRIASAEGLRKRDPVFFRGVNIGEVRSLSFTAAGDVLVDVRLRERVPLTTATAAELSPLDMFGRQSLVLREHGGSSVPLEHGDTIEASVPVALPARMSELGERASELLSDTTVALLHGVLAGAGNAAQQVADLSARLELLLTAQQQALGEALTASARLASNLSAATDPEALTALRTELTRVAAGVARLTTRMDSTVTAAGSVLAAIDEGQGSAGLLLRDRELYLRTSELLASAEALVRDIRENPKRYINVRVF